MPNIDDSLALHWCTIRVDHRTGRPSGKSTPSGKAASETARGLAHTSDMAWTATCVALLPTSKASTTTTKPVKCAAHRRTIRLDVTYISRELVSGIPLCLLTYTTASIALLAVSGTGLRAIRRFMS